jgi:hypothetical protein
MSSGPKVSNLLDGYIRPLNLNLVGLPAEQVIDYYDQAYANPSELSTFASPRYTFGKKDLKKY